MRHVVDRPSARALPKVEDGKPVNAATPGTTGGTSADDKAETGEKSISITLALPPDLAAKIALLDAMQDDIGQYRILGRQKGDTDPISGKNLFTYDDIFPGK